MAEKIQSSLISDDNLESMRTLVPGDTVDLQIAMPAAPKRVKTDYIGMLIDDCLLFHIPTSAKWITVRDALTVGNEIVVRSVLEGDTGQVIAFKVKVLKLLSKPSGLLITSFPKRVESIGLRSVKRAQLGISVSLDAEVYEDAENVTGIIIDLSEKGCKVVLKVKPNWPIMLDEAEVKLNYSLDGKEVALTAKVKNHKLESDMVYYGLAFTCDEKLIEELLSRHTLLT
ncbi:flagellar brake protein [Alteromonas sp. ALT199]|uniref:PilZ domain-containing protein n=1 Tax=unclassified Alteromonas TaxID=2614992 RepID=UPI000447ADE5|nr:PilZ domain-containing protein [Alteromonas sp. ALT199]MBT3137334.1 flagellar brake protein [Alteromonas sp. ALT199]